MIIICKNKNILFLIIIFCGIQFCSAQWTTDIKENTIFSWNTQEPIAVPDSKNGIILISQTHPQYAEIYAQRIGVDCESKWPVKQ